jgi:F-type H+-transporting ATPase subunit delta
MAENVTLARPYAEAAFRLAREENQLDGWYDALARMST